MSAGPALILSEVGRTPVVELDDGLQASILLTCQRTKYRLPAVFMLSSEPHLLEVPPKGTSWALATISRHCAELWVRDMTDYYFLELMERLLSSRQFLSWSCLVGDRPVIFMLVLLSLRAAEGSFKTAVCLIYVNLFSCFSP
jgi:hypothetical protein